MSESSLRHFEVRLSYPSNPSNPKSFHRNTEVHVLCKTLERAVELAREKYPDGVMHAVQPRSSNVTMIVDEQAPEADDDNLTATEWYDQGVRLGFITTTTS